MAQAVRDAADAAMRINTMGTAFVRTSDRGLSHSVERAFDRFETIY